MTDRPTADSGQRRFFGRSLDWTNSLIQQCCHASITLYQWTLSPLLGPRCRFYPPCSAYAKECLTLYPWPQALLKTCRRLLSCHPFHPGGVDLP